MAFSRRTEPSSSTSLTEPPSHFFKVILPATLEEKKLSIPEKFLRKFGDKLSAVATLRVPNGRVWQVGLTKDGRIMWFNDGWNEFLMHHSICAGYFLVFRYEENSNFHVLIFDKSACEITYPSNGEKVENAKQKSAVQQEATRSVDSVEIIDVRTPNPAVCSLKKNRVCDNGCPMLCGKMYESPSSQKNQANASSGSTRGIKRHPGCVASSSMSPKFKYDHGYESRGKKCKVEEPAEINESKAAKESSHGKLNSSNKMCNSQRPLSSNDKQTEVLAAEDELVVLLRDMGIYVARNFGVVSEIEREKVINVAKLFKSSKNPSFMAIMRERNIQRSSLYVPAKFTDKYLNRDFAYNIKLEDSDRKEWPVQLKGRSCGGGSDLTKGWCIFTKEKMLENGDILVFELIRKDDILLKVSVFQSTMV